MLRLVHPPPGGNGTDPPARRKGHPSPAFSLTPDEVRHLRATIHNVGRAYGSIACLADAMRVPVDTLYKHKRHSAAMALLVARAAGMSVEAVIGGKLSPAGQCSACGARAGDGRIVVAGAS